MTDARAFVLRLILLLICAMVLPSCKEEDEPCLTCPPPTSKIALDTVMVNPTAVWLKVILNTSLLGESKRPHDIGVRRDNDPFMGAFLLSPSKTDTIIYLEGLLPNRNYQFKAYLLNDTTGERIDSSAPYFVKTMDSTSHEFVSWSFDTLGWVQSRVYGLWGSDEKDVYAVGYFSHKISHSVLAHWDGTQWRYLTPMEFMVAELGFKREI